MGNLEAERLASRAIHLEIPPLVLAPVTACQCRPKTVDPLDRLDPTCSGSQSERSAGIVQKDIAFIKPAVGEKKRL
jgi:hypothetical protein